MRAANFINLFRQDMTITLRNSLAWFLMGTAVAMILFVNFAIPVEFAVKDELFYYDGTREKILERTLLSAGFAEELFLATPEDVEKQVESRREAVGIILSGSATDLHLTLVSTGQVSPQRLNIIHASLEQMIADLLGADRERDFAVSLLREQAEPVAQNMLAVPPLLAFEVLVTGFLLVAVLMFQEKQEGSLAAYRVSPGTAWGYILSKTLVFTVISLVYGIVITLFTVGTGINWPLLLLLVSLGAVFYTLVGMIVAVFFKNISQWFFVGMGILVLNMLPLISYTFPAFSPTFITWIPSYPIIFELRDVLFTTGREILPLVWLLLALIGAAYGVSQMLVNRKLMREGK